MRIATWNVNSVKSRLPRLLPWLADRGPDVLLLQETKSTDEAWPGETFSALAYDSAHLGTGRWNGVAVLSRVGLEHVTLGLPGQPAFEGVVEPRAIGVSRAGVRLWSLYVPNGRRAGGRTTRTSSPSSTRSAPTRRRRRRRSPAGSHDRNREPHPPGPAAEGRRLRTRYALACPMTGAREPEGLEMRLTKMLDSG